MATISFLRATRAGASRLLAPQIMARQVVPTTAVVPSQGKGQLLCAPSAGIRVYGPLDTVGPPKAKKWLFEKYSTASLIGIIPAAFLYQVPATEYLLVLGLQLHIHQMFEEVITDYIHGETLPKACRPVLMVISAVALAGMLNFTYNDVGPVGALKLLWAL